MKRRDFLKTSAALAASSAVLGRKAFGAIPPSVYKRPVHFVYGIGNNAVLDNTDAAIQSALAAVTNGVTCLCPFFLNSSDPTSNPAFTNMINWVQANNIVITPAVGLTAQGNTLNNATNIAIAEGYLPLGPHIRLENLSGYFQNPNGEADVKGFINNCIGMGFSKIMLNPWPVDANGNYMTFTANQMDNIDSTFQNVNPNTWVINSSVVSNILALDPTIKTLVNYESPGPQQTIAAMTKSQQENVFTTTIDDLATYPSSDHLFWAPPFTKSYNPLDEGTWTWIAGQLSNSQ